MPTLLELDTIEDCAKLSAELGLDFIELNMNLPQYQLGNVNVARFKAAAKEYGVNYTVHLDENFNACDFNAYVADAYLNTLVNTIELAKRLDAPIINMHLSKGVYFTLPDKKVFLFDKYFDEYLDGTERFCDVCERALRDSGIAICIENTDGYENFQRKALELILKREVFALTYDIGHDYASGGKDEDFILSHIDRLRHFHIHDAKTARDHLTIGDGEVDIRKYVNMAKDLGASAVIETKTVSALRESCLKLKSL